jgi:hypothetical protein
MLAVLRFRSTLVFTGDYGAGGRYSLDPARTERRFFAPRRTRNFCFASSFQRSRSKLLRFNHCQKFRRREAFDTTLLAGWAARSVADHSIRSTVGASCLAPGLKARLLRISKRTAEEPAEKPLFCALRFATRMPSAEWCSSFSAA